MELFEEEVLTKKDYMNYQRLAEPKTKKIGLTAQFYYEEGSVTRASQNIAFGALPDPYGVADSYQNYGYSVYCTYLK